MVLQPTIRKFCGIFIFGQISVEIIGSILNLGIETTFIGGLVLEVHGDACTGAVALGTGGVAYIFNLIISFNPENFNGTIFILLVILNLFMGKNQPFIICDRLREQSTQQLSHVDSR